MHDEGLLPRLTMPCQGFIMPHMGTMMLCTKDLHKKCLQFVFNDLRPKTTLFMKTAAEFWTRLVLIFQLNGRKGTSCGGDAESLPAWSHLPGRRRSTCFNSEFMTAGRAATLGENYNNNANHTKLTQTKL